MQKVSTESSSPAGGHLQPARRLSAALSSPPPTWLMPAIVVTGVVLRLIQYCWNISYFHDEVSLFWNIRDKSFLEFFGPLAHNQAAPPLFLILEKIIYQHLGEREMVMRLPAFLASCLTIVCFAKLSHRLLAGWPAIISTWLLICSSELLSHSALLKPYAIDVFLAVMFTLMAVEFTRGQVAARWAIFCGAAALLVGLSYPMLLIFAGISLALLPIVTARTFRGWTLYVSGNLFVGFVAAVLMHQVEGAQHTPYMHEAWDRCFLHLSRPLEVPRWLFGTFFNLCNRSWKPNGFLVLPLFLIGAVCFYRRDRFTMAILIGPLLMNLAAAAMCRYPFDSDRLTLYLLPSVFILAAAGASAVVAWFATSWRWVGGLPTAVVLLIATATAGWNVAWPPAFTFYRPLIAFIRSHAQAEDVIYSPWEAEFRYYWPQASTRIRIEMDFADRIPCRRFWVAWSNPTRADHIKYQKQCAWAKRFAIERERYADGRNEASLFEINVDRPPHTIEPINPR